ncbi:MAG: hypothetical protein HLUCCA13_15065 [Halomonas sp. HL-48]|nr:MAG: hypothetical protein HLUCCA13_15065 [Halomonas sp. HL-48]
MRALLTSLPYCLVFGLVHQLVGCDPRHHATQLGTNLFDFELSVKPELHHYDVGLRVLNRRLKNPIIDAFWATVSVR